MVTLVERKSGFALMKVVRRLASRNMTRAIRNATSPLPPELKQILTLDNGKEFARHATLHRQTGLAIYFARPYHAWERGSNEHFNGLLRGYFPKGTDFRRTVASEVQHVLDRGAPLGPTTDLGNGSTTRPAEKSSPRPFALQLKCDAAVSKPANQWRQTLYLPETSGLTSAARQRLDGKALEHARLLVQSCTFFEDADASFLHACRGSIGNANGVATAKTE